MIILFPDQSKQGCKDQESIQSSTTPDPGHQWESDKLTEDTTNESQEVSPFPAGDHEAHTNRRAQNIANTKQNKNIKDPQKKESKIANCDWVDYQACSLLQYINVITNLFIMGNYFNELR